LNKQFVEIRLISQKQKIQRRVLWDIWTQSQKIVTIFKSLIRTTSFAALQPKEILDKIFLEIEKRKKLGIEESAYVPNVYAIYLSPC